MFRESLRVVCGVVLASSVGGWLVLSALPVRAQDDPFGDGSTGKSASAAAASDNPFEASEPAPARDASTHKEAAPKPQQAVEALAAVKPGSAAEAADPLTASFEAKIRQALRHPTRMEFTEQPLQDAITYLADYHQIPIQFDHRALHDAGIGSDTPMTLNVNGIALAPALRLLLHDLDVTYVVRDSVLLITTKDAAASMLEVQVYGLTEMVDGTNVEKFAEMLTSLSGNGQHGICKVKGDMTIVPMQDLLIVQASQHDHEEIAALIAKIKDERAKMAERAKALRGEK